MNDHTDTATLLSQKAAPAGAARGRGMVPRRRRSALALAATIAAAPVLLIAAGATPAAAQDAAKDSAPKAAAQTTDAGTTGSGATASKSTTTAALDDLIAKGKYLTTAADCMPCHTGPNAKPFSGGLMLDTPFGGISSPNITPDVQTGIGSWSEKDFYRALHHGIGKGGEYLYPAMPYTSFTKMTEDDVKAVYTYLHSLEPVSNPRKPNTLTFPFNVRDGLAAWDLMYFTPGTFKPDPKVSDQINRGAYLVEGPGHCAECHTPRNVAGAMKGNDFLGGGKLLGQPYYAPDISGSLQEGIGDWSVDEIVDYLHKGADAKKGTVFGPMADVVTHSLSKLTDDDITAIATYLKHSKAEGPKETKVADTTTKAGSEIYLNNCAQCHQSTGLGITGSIPPLAGNDAVMAAGPEDVITAVLGGLPGQGSYIQMPAFGGQFSDQQVADVVNFVRTNWGNDGSANATTDMVSKLRGEVTPTGAGSEAARKFGCPAVTDSGSQNAIPAPAKAIMDGFQGITDDEMANRVGELVRLVKGANQGASDADLADTLVAAYCPTVASDADLTISEKKARVDTFLTEVNSALGETSAMPSGSQILIQVPLPENVANQVNEAARQAKEQPGAYLGKLVEDSLKTQSGGSK